MNKYWIPGPITNYGTTVAGFKGEVRVVEAAEFDRYAHANKVQAEEIKALAARLAEMRQAMDELHIKHGRSMRRLAEAERLLADIVDDAAFMACRCGAPTCRTTIVRNFLRPADSAIAQEGVSHE